MIRMLQHNDREDIQRIIADLEQFNEDEKIVAMELIDDFILLRENSHYKIFVYEDNNKVQGFCCIGKRPLTDGVFDLYWLAVKKESQNRGIGKKLILFAEHEIQQNKGRWILAETSSKNSYLNTRNFYIKNEYSVVTQIDDFYKEGDNLIVFGKKLKNIKE